MFKLNQDVFKDKLIVIIKETLSCVVMELLLVLQIMNATSMVISGDVVQPKPTLVH